jgi:hypothetical protein
MDCNSANVFRANWRYQRLDAGEGMLRSGTGLSPGFRSLLETVKPREGTSFQELAAAFPRLDGDDLEIWLAELCRMQLIAPAETPLPVVQQVELSTIEPSCPAERGNHESALFAEAEAKAKVVDILSPASPPEVKISVLIVARAGDERVRWRAALSNLPITIREASTLAEAEVALRDQSPQAVVLGADGVDFKPLQLISYLKHPRIRNSMKVFVMLDSASASKQNLHKASMADGIMHPAEMDQLTAQIACVLKLPLTASEHSLSTMSTQGSPEKTLNFRQAKQTDEHATSKLSLLEIRYPRVALKIAEHWGKPTLTGVLNNLILDSRGGRRGFCQGAMEEILFLLDMHLHFQPAMEFWQQNHNGVMRRVSPKTSFPG